MLLSSSGYNSHKEYIDDKRLNGEKTWIKSRHIKKTINKYHNGSPLGIREQEDIVVFIMELN